MIPPNSSEFEPVTLVTSRTANFDVTINDPYKGAELTRRYADPAAKRHSLQIEMSTPE